MHIESLNVSLIFAYFAKYNGSSIIRMTASKKSSQIIEITIIEESELFSIPVLQIYNSRGPPVLDILMIIISVPNKHLRFVRKVILFFYFSPSLY